MYTYEKTTTLGDVIPSPAQLKLLRQETAKDKYTRPCRDSIVKAMLKGERTAHIQADANLKDSWDVVWDVLKKEFYIRGWNLSFHLATGVETGYEPQNYKADFYIVGWGEVPVGGR